MITSFRHKGLEAFYLTASTRGSQPPHRSRLLRILAALDAASSANELNHPGFKFHSLKGTMKGRWSVWVNGNWRVTFRFAGGDVDQVDYVDDH